MDKNSGLVHTTVTTAANVSDVSVTSSLLHGEEESVNGDSGHIGAEKREDALLRNKNGRKIKRKINRRPSQYTNNGARSRGQIKRREKEKSSVRSKAEHVFGVVKKLFGYRKTRCRGLSKQNANSLWRISIWLASGAWRPDCHAIKRNPISIETVISR